MYKRCYHPTIIIRFWQGTLSDEMLNQIPASTRAYWSKIKQDQLYGYEWIRDCMTENIPANKTLEYKQQFTAKRILCRVYNCFHMLTKETLHFRRTLKNNMHHVIKTIDAIAVTLPLKIACRIFNFTTHKYYHYKNKINCTASLLNLCFKTHSQQLSLQETAIIKNEIEKTEHKTHPLSTIYYLLINSGKLACSLGTFYKYVFLLRGKMLNTLSTKAYHPLKAIKPFQYLHVDVTNINSLEGIFKVAFIKDNFSKAILNFAISRSADSNFIRTIFEKTFEQYQLNTHKETITIVSDGGPENKGSLTEWINALEAPDTDKLTAKLDIPSSNSMSESANYIFKHSYLKDKVIHNEKELYELLTFFLSDYNHHRYPIVLYGYTPFEVLYGAIPDKNRFKELMLQARKTRFEQNHKDRCEKCIF